jgi:hypothetical protein
VSFSVSRNTHALVSGMAITTAVVLSLPLSIVNQQAYHASLRYLWFLAAVCLKGWAAVPLYSDTPAVLS